MHLTRSFVFGLSLLIVVAIAIPSYLLGSPIQQDQKKQVKAAKNQEKPTGKGPAFTEPPKDDPSYKLMGEFFGKINDGDGEQQLGLQIRVFGEDQFEANAYLGGLPGQPKFQPKPFQMVGRRSGDFLILSGGPWAILIEKNLCRVIDRKGKQIGQLKRIRRSSPTMHAAPPEEALVLFDGTNTEHFTNGKMTSDGLLMEGADLKPMFQDFNLHIEFRIPYMPLADKQARGNSGLYLQSRYECQILDSFGTVPVVNGCGALYRFRKPDLNMSFPPLVWQTYDVQFTAPRWASDGTKIRNAHVTSWVNGVKVQDNISLPNKTGAGKIEEPSLLPIRIQNHGDPVRFRNIWIVDRGLATIEFPLKTTKEERTAANKKYQKRARETRKRLAKEKREQEKD